VRSTERRIFNFSVIESLMMVSMAALQVFVVRFFFQGARKGTLIPFALRGPAGLGRWLRLEYNAFAFSFLFFS
jgi:hypothetical protein